MKNKCSKPKLQRVIPATFCALTATVTLFSILIFVPATLRASPPVSFFNTNTIIINAGDNPPTIATPYPSSITVTGLTGQVILKATITLSNFSHSFPSDVDVLLVGPQGQMTFPMSEVGGFEREPVTNITLTIDDDADEPLPLDGYLTTGTFQPNKLHPTNYFDMPLPAPPGNSNAPAMMSVFKGTDPNGTWSLYVVQDNAADSGMISNGWSLNITSGVLLDIKPDNSTNFVVSWTNSAVGYTLQSATNLSPPAVWNNVPAPPGNVSGHFTVTNPVANGDIFYRLIKN
jgi:hypothetical protein